MTVGLKLSRSRAPDGSDCNTDTSLASGRNRRLSREAVALTARHGEQLFEAHA
jgi:hypothetical protein